MRIDRIKLITEMAKQDMKQKDLAERAGISRATVNYVKSGKSCSEKVGKKIANALGVEVNAFRVR